jgi:hypothetical protein
VRQAVQVSSLDEVLPMLVNMAPPVYMFLLHFIALRRSTQTHQVSANDLEHSLCAED